MENMTEESRSNTVSGTPETKNHLYKAWIAHISEDLARTVAESADSAMRSARSLQKNSSSHIRTLHVVNFTIYFDVDLTNEFLSPRFSMKNIGEADVILDIRIKHESNGITISQSYYIKKVLKKSIYFDCTIVSTPMDISEKLMPNNGQVVSQLKYSNVIGCLMYAMTCTRPDIAFVVGKLSKYISNPVLKGYTDVSWINNTEDNSSISGGDKPIAPISIRYDSVATLAKAYS
ncbi:zinc finger, CCHC-type containing protein [Tanacetum coccineum]